MQITCKSKVLDLSTPQIMGILNVTPDSFSDGGLWNSADKALDHAVTMLNEGASIIDIGGESTRPGAPTISEDEELSRVIPAVERIAKETDAIISVDTSSPVVMREACKAGAHIWNDIRALSRENAVETAKELDIPVILMHMQGTPQDMQNDPNYNNVVEQVKKFLLDKAEFAVAHGIDRSKIIFDLGFGFGKTAEHNFTLLNHMQDFVNLGYPVLSALSRKTMIGSACGIKEPAQRVIGSVVGALLSVERGAAIVRVHDVKETKQALDVYMAMKATA
ncbi:dihydropteroate synthase [Succinivibrio dextrinosolvens]|uniref:dihydropteroate synthase n=1 Tax=Succinivibrio dextrinosolvens TaxID=83771 RepID=UPI00241E1ED6|nr:dihydropteroate synthase [Succinivibrio dextrinosolvens]MBE6422787.1 dihydropteroate synthase [Succinivibrio dextrinosolvens]